MNISEYAKLVHEIRLELGYERGVASKITRQSIGNHGEILIIHLLTALALTKHRTSQVCIQYEIQLGSEKFGCHLVNQIHFQGWKFTGTSIFRVLRELQEGILTSGRALKLLKSILSNCIGSDHQQEMINQ